MRFPRIVSTLLACLVVSCAGSAGAAPVEKTVSGVPSYEWYYGCGPTAGGMIIGYWDAHGYPDLITAGDGTNSWDDNQEAVKAMIASEGHIDDYWGTDADPPTHTDNCVADFMEASRDPLANGESYAYMQDDGLVGYANYMGYGDADGDYVWYNHLWDLFVGEIDAGRPMEFYVDVTADDEDQANHFVAAIGYRYDDEGGGGEPINKAYACYNTYDHTVHWKDFKAVAPGETYGIETGTWFYAPEPAALGLLAAGLGWVLVRRRARR